jgi:Flp pilus assembly protein TadD
LSRLRHRLRPTVWTALLVVLSPLAFVTVAELGLRAVGFGNAPTLFRPIPSGGAYTTNLGFAYRFFSRDIAIRPAPLYFAAEKPEDGYRVFVVGGSAAFGDFMPEYGLARILEVLLEERYPGVAFEVVNAAVAAVNSHVVLPIVREAARHDSDLIVVYLGNNEVVGPYGPGSVRSRTGSAGDTPSLLRVRAGLWARGLRLGQLIERALVAPGIGSPGEAPEALAAGDLTRALVRFDDPRLPLTYAHFDRNLRDMLRAATASGGEALVVTVASNLRNFSPFASLHRRDLGDEETGAFDTAYAEGLARQRRGECEGALAAYARAAAIDDQFAVLDFQRGTCLLRLGRIDEARAALVRARELDAGRYRADSTINAILRETEADGVRLLDGEARFAESGLAPVPIPGDEFFYDHVHLSFDGSYLLARAVFETVEPMLPAWIRSRATGSPASVSAVAEALALTPFDRERLARLIAARKAKLGAEPEGEGAEVARVSAFWRKGEESGLDGDSAALYRRAIERRPADLPLRRNFATLLLAEGDPAAAAEQLRVLVERVPDIAEWRVAYGTALRLDGRYEEALRQLETAVSLDPADFQAEFQLASVLRELDRDSEAIDHYERVLLSHPANLAFHFQLGTLRLERGELDAAVSHFEAVLHGAPGNAEAHNALGVALFNQGELQRSVAHLRKALQIDPQNATARENLQAALRGLQGQRGRAGGP